MKFIEFRASVRLLTALLALTASHAHAASFDCTKARSQVEHLVCDTPALSQLDETLATTYRAALSNDPASRQRQLTWLRRERPAVWLWAGTPPGRPIDPAPWTAALERLLAED